MGWQLPPKFKDTYLLNMQDIKIHDINKTLIFAFLNTTLIWQSSVFRKLTKSSAYLSQSVHWPQLKRGTTTTKTCHRREIQFVEELLLGRPPVEVENEIKY